jgi:hypothetical protein
MKSEAFTELRPATEGANLRHWRTSREHFGRHFTGADCPCGPESVPHVAPNPSPPSTRRNP